MELQCSCGFQNTNIVNFYLVTVSVLLQSAVLKTRSYNQCLLAISVDSLAEVKHGGVVALKRFSISNYKHR